MTNKELQARIAAARKGTNAFNCLQAQVDAVVEYLTARKPAKKR